MVNMMAPDWEVSERRILLTVERLERMPDRMGQSLAGRRILSALLGRATGHDSWDFRRDAAGRPFAHGPARLPVPDISLSHAGPWVAGAVAMEGRIGVDVEATRPGRDAGRLAEAYLSPAERTAVEREGEAALLAFWTLREAIGKALGTGLAAALAVDGDALAPARGTVAPVTLDGRDWLLGQRGFPHFSVALAWLPPDGAAGVDGLRELAAALDSRDAIRAAT